MGRVHDTVGTVNTTIRTLLMLVLVGIAGVLGYTGYELYNEPRKELADKQAELDKTLETLKKANGDLEASKKVVNDLSVKLAETTANLEKLEVRMRLLKVRSRLARLTVFDQREATAEEAAAVNPAAVAETPEANGNSPTNIITTIEFTELSEEGDPIGETRKFEIVGDMVYVDYLRVSFEDKYIEEADLDRSTAIALFQRIFGEHQEAAEGYTLDRVGTRPAAYDRGTEMSDFERKLWAEFWLIANDKEKAAELGIHAAHSNAVDMRVQPNMSYEIKLRSTGEMTITPLDPQRAAVNENPVPAQPPN
jgi:hypothetical protein